MDAIEITNRDAREYDHPDRPQKTEADRIALAARLGGVHVRNFLDVIDDQGSVDHTYCRLCLGELDLDYVQEIRQAELDYFGTKWDPTIRL